MKSYFKFIGGLLIVSFIAGAIIDLIYLIQLIQLLSKTNGNNQYTGEMFLLIFIFVFCLIVGPSLGLLFLSHAGVLEREEKRLYPTANNSTNTQNNSNVKIAEAKAKADLDFLLKYGVINKEQYEEKKANIKEEAIKYSSMTSQEKAQLKANLDVKLDAGLITQEEYDEQIKKIQ